MRHPLNRPVLDERRRVVRAGYGIIQPQIRTELAAASATPFARFFSGGAGSDPYRGSHSELCHELFDESSFCGKGILDIDCFLTCLEGRFPEQLVLSHDILEGAYLRTGYLSQISFRDGFPATVSSFYRRQHRWVRGDWQNFAWVLPHVPSGEGAEQNPISAVSRWKLADNLRRSLTPVAQMVCLLWAAAAGDGFGWLGWIALASVALDPILAYIFDIIPRRSLRRFHSRIQTGLRECCWGYMYSAGAAAAGRLDQPHRHMHRALAQSDLPQKPAAVDDLCPAKRRWRRAAANLSPPYWRWGSAPQR